MPHKNIRNIHFRDQEEDRNLYINPSSEQATKDAATAAGMYSPNGLIFYQISGKEQINLTNAALFKLFGDATRIQILHALESKEMCVCDLAVLLGVTKSAVSHQLQALRLANLVKFRRDGQIVYYSLADEHVKQIIDIGMEHLYE